MCPECGRWNALSATECRACQTGLDVRGKNRKKQPEQDKAEDSSREKGRRGSGREPREDQDEERAEKRRRGDRDGSGLPSGLAGPLAVAVVVAIVGTWIYREAIFDFVADAVQYAAMIVLTVIFLGVAARYMSK
jgi:hypothetical protein